MNAQKRWSFFVEPGKYDTVNSMSYEKHSVRGPWNNFVAKYSDHAHYTSESFQDDNGFGEKNVCFQLFGAKPMFRQNGITKLLAVIMLLFNILPLSLAKGSSFSDVSYITYDTSYEAIIKMYIRVLNAYGTNREGHHDLFNDAIINDFHQDVESPMPHRIAEAKKRVGFCIYDLNGDGVEELIIGENSAYVNEVFTIDEGRVRELITAWGKYDCSLLKNGYFCRYSRDGGALSSETVWKMNGTKEVVFVEGYYRNDQYNGYQPGVEYEYYLDNWFRISKDPFKYEVDYSENNKAPRGEMLHWLKEKDAELLHLSFVPFAAYEAGIDSENIGILCKDGQIDKQETIRIRKAPNNKAKVILNKRIGTYVNIIGEDGDYYKVRIQDKTGYVSKQFIIRLKDNPGIGAKKVSIYPYDYEEYLIKKYGVEY